MKILVILALVTIAYANVLPTVKGNTKWGYIINYAIPLAEKIRKAEEQLASERIVGGHPSNLGQFPYQAGLVGSYVGISSPGVCGGSIVTPNRVVTAAHCWYDGVNQAWRFTVVLGSTTLFSGGTRIDTSVIAMHPNCLPRLARNDVAVIYLPTSVSFSDTISPIALPSESHLQEDFDGVTAIASGFGLTSTDGSVSTNQFLSGVNLTTISNTVCSLAYPVFLHSTNICTSGLGGIGVCRGDSGGPLVTDNDGELVLIGVTSFISAFGCDVGFPAAYARVTSYMDFFNQHL